MGVFERESQRTGTMGVNGRQGTSRAILVQLGEANSASEGGVNA